jgi:hypothetical protein
MGPEGPNLGREDAATTEASHHLTAKQRRLTTWPPWAAPLPERRRSAGRGDPRASLPGTRVEAGPPPPAPRGLCPAACADGGEGGGGGKGGSRREERVKEHFPPN